MITKRNLQWKIDYLAEEHRQLRERYWALNNRLYRLMEYFKLREETTPGTTESVKIVKRKNK